MASLQAHGDGLMALEDVTLTLFAACNGVRVLAYIPQIRQAAVDKNGATAISCTTWSLFLVAHLSTVAYVLVNRSDWGLAACFAGNAICCAAILAVVYWKRRVHAERLRSLDSSGAKPAYRQSALFSGALPSSFKAQP
jgi:hypothetical protein